MKINGKSFLSVAEQVHRILRDVVVIGVII